MAEKYFPFRSVSGDRKYSAEDWAAYFALFLSNGVFYSSVDKLKVAANEGMKVKVGKGAAFIAGRMYMLETDKIITLDTADGALNRIDRIVLRCDYTSRKITTEVVKGSYSENPTAPALNRNSDIYELALADVYVAAGVISITQSNITDQRLNTSLCGIVTGLIDQADTEEVFNQFTAYYEEFKAASQAEFELQQDAWEAEFTEWFEEIKGVFEGDVAAELANRVLELEDGTTPAGNANALGGHEADYFAKAEELQKIEGKQWLSTSILEKALEVEYGIHNYCLGGNAYTGEDLPASANWRYGVATIYKRSAASIAVEVHSEAFNKTIVNSYNGIKWTGWGEGVTLSELITELAKYLSLNGGTINGNLLAWASEAVQRFLLVSNKLRQCNMQVTPDGRFLLYDNTNAKNIIQSTADGTNTFNGSAIENLLLSGGILTGNLYFKKVENGQGIVYKDHNANNDYGMVLRDDDASGNSVRMLLSALSNGIRFRDTTGTYNDILHTGNSAKVVMNASAPADTTALWVY